MEEFKNIPDDITDHFKKIKHLKERTCPYCNCAHTVRYGKYNGKQRYKCKVCCKTFGDFTNTPFAMTRFPQRWGRFMECMIEGLSLRKSGKILQISYVTLFYWRHKLLSALREIKQDEMKGLVELQSFYLKYSRKGQKYCADKKGRKHGKSMSYYNIENNKVCVLTAEDLFKHIFSKAVCKGHMNSSDIERSIGKLLTRRNVVCSKPKLIFAAFFKKMHIKESKRALDKTNKVVRYTEKCLSWLSRFKGVSTKYLNNYLNLYKFLKRINFDKTLSGLKAVTTAISDVNIRNTYKSVRNIKMYT